MSEVLPKLLRVPRFELSALVMAAEQSVASTMLGRVSDGMDPGDAVRLGALSLAAYSPVPVAACYRVAAELALALGLISIEEADALASGGGDSAKETTPGNTDADREHAEGPAAPSAEPDIRTDDWFHWGDEPDTVHAQAPASEDGGGKKGGAGRPAQTGVKPTASRPAQPSEEPLVERETEPGPQAGFVPSPPPAPPPDQLGYGPSDAASWSPPPMLADFHRQSAPLSEEWISELVRDTVHPGLLAFNPPSEMHQGRSERIEVGVARSPELRDALTAGFRGRGLPEVVEVDTAPLMGVELRGPAFAIEALSSTAEQLVVPLARWEFDVTPLKPGSHTLTLCVTIRVQSPYFSGGRIAVPVFERDIQIKVDVVYGTRRFVANNWQWLVGTAVGLGGGIAAWISLVH
jgi:hypothetical protein